MLFSNDLTDPQYQILAVMLFFFFKNSFHFHFDSFLTVLVILNK